MPRKPKFDPRKLMEKAIESMRDSIPEPRDDDSVSPKVGAVLWKPDGTVETAYRGELRQGDHAEYTLLERKNGASALDGCVLFATLEPCGPGSRKPPKVGCAKRIVNARIKEVWVGCQDPHPKVAGRGFAFLKSSGIVVNSFDRDLQETIRKENARFFEQAERKADAEEREEATSLSEYENVSRHVTLTDLSDDALTRYRLLLMGKSSQDEGEFHRRLYHQGLLEMQNGNLLPTGFGALLFGKHPRDVMEQAGVLGTIRLEEGREDPRDFDGPMVLAPEQAIQWLRDKLLNPISRTEARRKELNEILYELVREGLVNALVHRDYDIKQAKIQLVVTPRQLLSVARGDPWRQSRSSKCSPLRPRC